MSVLKLERAPWRLAYTQRKKKHTPSDSEEEPSLSAPPSPLPLFKLVFTALLQLLSPALCMGGGAEPVCVWEG